MPTPRQHWLRTANQLRHLLDSEPAAAALDHVERDWAALLRDRLFQAANRQVGP